MPRKPSMVRALSQLLDASSRPIYVVNERREIVYCNVATADWAGLETVELTSRRCTLQDDSAKEPAQRVADGLCPPPEAFVGERCETVLSFTTPSGALLRRRATFTPLAEDDLACPGVLAVVAEEELALDDLLRSATESSPPWRAMLAAVRHALSRRYNLAQLIGQSPVMQRVREQVQLTRGVQTRVVICGPPGSGREHVARSIYYGNDANAERPLVPLSCALLDAELLESTLASMRSFELEDDLEPGTLMLLDVDQLDPTAQGALMQELAAPDCQLGVISTSRQSLEALVATDAFREDLAHALSTLQIQLPPLAERRDDIPLLCQAFLEEYNAGSDRQLSGFDAESLDQLIWHEFPENVDSLREIVLESCAMAAGPLVEAEDLPMEIRLAAIQAAHPKREPEPIQLDQFLETMEAELIRRALAETRGNRAQAARLLDISRPRLLRRMSHFGID